MVKDLVCGMSVNEKVALKSNYKGKTYYFCSISCQQAFNNNQEKFVK